MGGGNILSNGSLNVIKPRDKQLAEKVFKQIYDPKAKKLTERGQEVLDQIPNLTLGMIIPKKFESFLDNLGGNEDMARVHYEHHCKRRIKSLLKI